MNSKTAVLRGELVRLEPLDPRHAEQLLAAATQDPSLYTWSFVPTSADAVKRYIETAIDWRDAGKALPFAIIRLRDNLAVGSTRFFDFERWTWPDASGDPSRAFDACEIGYTWLGSDAVRTGINTEAKLLMLGHAFEQWRVRRVCFFTDERNSRSRSALQGIGATFEGVLRSHRVATDLTARNSARFSILETEWPEVKAHLISRLHRI